MRLVTAYIPDASAVAPISAALADAELNIFGFAADKRRIRIITDAAPGVLNLLEGLGIPGKNEPVVAIRLDDEPGGLANVTQVLHKGGVSISLAFGSTHQEQGIIYLRVDNQERAEELLSAIIVA